MRLLDQTRCSTFYVSLHGPRPSLDESSPEYRSIDERLHAGDLSVLENEHWFPRARGVIRLGSARGARSGVPNTAAFAPRARRIVQRAPRQRAEPAVHPRTKSARPSRCRAHGRRQRAAGTGGIAYLLNIEKRRQRVRFRPSAQFGRRVCQIHRLPDERRGRPPPSNGLTPQSPPRAPAPAPRQSPAPAPG